MIKYGLLPLALAAAIGFSIAAYLGLGRRQLRWMPVLRATLVACVAVLLFVPSWTRESREVYRPSLAVMLDSSMSMQIAETSGGKTRYERAMARLAEVRERFGGQFDIDLWSYARKAERIPAPPGVPLGKESELAAALQEVLNHQDKGLTRGVFVIGDGRSTSVNSPLPWARTSAFPIVSLAVGSAEFPYKDLEIAAVDAPDRLYKDSLGQISVRVRAHGIEAGVVMLEQGGRKLDQKPFSSKDGGPVVFELHPAGSGLTLYTVSATAQPGELTTLNNSRTFPIFIETTPRKVLLLPATPNWEYTFLKRQLRADPRYEVTDPAQFGAGTTLEFPAGGLAGFGLVIVSGFRKQAFSPEQIGLLARHVEGGDGVLLLIGNTRDSVDELLSSDLARVLPVVSSSGADEPAARLPFGPSEKSPLFRILEHPQANQQAWRSLPPILVAQPALMPLPAATVLGSFPRYPKDTPALSYRLFGRGMTVLFDTDETYLWKTLMDAASDPDHLYERFWGNFLSWLTDDARLSGVSLTLSRLHYTLGDEVFVRVEDFSGKLEAVSREDLALTYQGEGGSGRLSPEKVQGGFLASFVPPSEGRFTVKLALPGGEDATKELVVDAAVRDFTEPGADPETLREMAELSGGRFFAEGTGDLSSLKLDPTPRVKQRSESLYWLDRGWALALCLGLLACEWLMRKKWNLV
ncbi:MAG: VWA domain-containing protein [Candidatus Wallbacteria bacterium]|nr:VWA domain-containing protein [Candidatus Wallbacteria bacterium]